jgi:hypothetical protein
MPQKLNVKTDEGDFLAIYVQAIDGNPNAFRVVNENGKHNPSSVEITENRKKEFHFFDGVWIENDVVTTLVILTGEKIINIGNLV